MFAIETVLVQLSLHAVLWNIKMLLNFFELSI